MIAGLCCWQCTARESYQCLRYTCAVPDDLCAAAALGGHSPAQTAAWSLPVMGCFVRGRMSGGAADSGTGCGSSSLAIWHMHYQNVI